MQEPTPDADAVPEEEGLLFACVLDGEGRAALRDWAAVESWQPGDGPLWVHFDRTEPRVQRWLAEQSGLTPVTVDAMLSEESRPRTFRGKRGTIAILRGINTNPGAEPFDMLDFRLWSDGERLISIRHHRLKTPRDILAALLGEGDGPHTTPELFERLISRLTERIADSVEHFEETLDGIEAETETLDPHEARRRLSEVRREAVVLRRYMAPQREAVATLHQEPPAWLDDTSRLRLRETANRLMQFVETVDETRERAVVLEDGIANRMAEQMNRNMYVLSIVAAIFLPLGFVTGLLGINVGGMPGVENTGAFWITCGAIGLLLVLELMLFRALKWI